MPVLGSSSTGGAGVLADGGTVSTYTPATAYAAGQVVSYLGLLYMAPAALTSGANPSFTRSQWTLIGETPIPEAVEGVKVIGYGTSYTSGTGASMLPNPISGSYLVSGGGTTYFQRFAGRIRSGWIENWGLGGSSAIDVAAQMFGTVTGNAAFTAKLGIWGLVVIEPTINDVKFGSASAQALLGFDNALHSAIQLVRAGTVVDDQSFTTPFTSTASTQFSSGHYGQTSTQNAATTYTFTATASTATLILVGQKDATGGTAQVKVDGSVVATINLANQCEVTNQSRSQCPVPVELTGLTLASHTITVTKTDTTGTLVGVDCLLLPATTRFPKVLVVKGTYGSPGAEATKRDAINNRIDTVVTAIGAPASQVSAVDTLTGWDSTTMLANDGLHPNDKGHRFYAGRLLDVLVNQPYQDGLNRYALA